MNIPACYERINPPDIQEPMAICPNCGAYLYEGDHLYVYYERGYRKELACSECINDFIEVVGEW